MDPASLTATAIAIVTFASQICKSIASLRSLCKTLPGRIHAVSNEVADLELVLLQLATLMESRKCLLESRYSAMPHLLSKARTKLSELETIINKLIRIQSRSKVSYNLLNAWRNEQTRIKEIQDDIRSVKSSLNIMLGATSSDDMLKIRLDIQDISTMTGQSSQAHVVMSQKVMMTLAGVDQRVARVEEMLQQQSDMLKMNQFIQVQSAYGTGSPASNGMPAKGIHNTTASAEGTTLGIRVTPSAIPCPTNCICSCHSQKSLTSPTLLSNVFGRLFVHYAGLPTPKDPCNSRTCQRYRSSKFSLEYWFPAAVLSRIVRMEVSYHHGVGPSFQLDILRTIPDDAQCVNFAIDGNVKGLKHLFESGLASPRDVSVTRGYSLLRWALYSKQYATCEFLIQAGADVDYKPIGAFDNSPRIKACHFLLEGNLSESAVQALRAITRGSEHLDDFIDDSNFTKMHRIVLGISSSELEAEVLLNPNEINIQDSMGRTALASAAARNDSRAIVTLLRYGADPNVIDVQISGALSNAAAQGHTSCVKLLLDAGANPDPPLPKSIRKGGPLNVAARNAKDPVLVKVLLDFGADVDQAGVDGKTALFHAAQKDNARLAILLLENGAAINLATTTGDTPLTAAITHNSHNVLKLFLERWHEYTVCPRLKGPHLLKITAMYASIETIRILLNTDHFRLNYDGNYAIGDFKKIVRERRDASEKLTGAFDELLSIFEGVFHAHHIAERMLEAGQYIPNPTRSSTWETIRSEDDSDDDSNDSDDSFKDALTHM